MSSRRHPSTPGLEAAWQSFIEGFVTRAAARIRADQDAGVASTAIEATLATRAIVHLLERMITQELARAYLTPRSDRSR